LARRIRRPGDEAHIGVEGLGDALQRPGRRARGAAFDAADVAFVDAAARGELRLREAVLSTRSMTCSAMSWTFSKTSPCATDSGASRARRSVMMSS